MTSSYEKIMAEHAREKLILWLSFGALVILSCFVVVVALGIPNKNKIINSYGLILDFVGVLFVSYTIIFPAKKKAKQGVQFLSNMPRYRPQVLAEHAEKHGVKLQVGVLIVSFGFLMQLMSNWL